MALHTDSEVYEPEGRQGLGSATACRRYPWTSLRGRVLPKTFRDFANTSVPHIHTIINLANSIFLETERKIDKVFDVSQNSITDRNRMKLRL
jgi:hypothetical protein